MHVCGSRRTEKETRMSDYETASAAWQERDDLVAELLALRAENERLRTALKRAATTLAWIKANWGEPGIKSMRRVDEGLAVAAAELERKPE